ncbi:MAG: hypothetical protein OXM01_09810 [Gemmatimonadota bacterium]|nr:hypothetical protein [Gemmatimonadota bacterium]
MTEDERKAWDTYAAHAAAGILAGREAPDLYQAPNNRDCQKAVVRDAAKIADQLLAERQARG